MINIAILGAGGLGQNMALLIEQKKDFNLVGICDRSGYVFNENGISGITVKEASSVEKIKLGAYHGTPSNNPIKDLISSTLWLYSTWGSICITCSVRLSASSWPVHSIIPGTS